MNNKLIKDLFTSFKNVYDGKIEAIEDFNRKIFDPNLRPLLTRPIDKSVEKRIIFSDTNNREIIIDNKIYNDDNIKLSAFADLMRLPVNDINNIFNHFIRAIDIINFNINIQFVNQINEIYKIYNDYLTDKYRIIFANILADKKFISDKENEVKTKMNTTFLKNRKLARLDIFLNYIQIDLNNLNRFIRIINESLENVLDNSLFENYTYYNFIDGFNLIKKIIIIEYDRFANEFNKDLYKFLNGNKNGNKNKESYENAKKPLLFQGVLGDKDKYLEAFQFIDDFENLSEEEQKKGLIKYRQLFDNKKGNWIEDIDEITDSKFKEELKEKQLRYQKYLIYDNPDEIDKDKHGEIKEFYNELKVIGDKLKIQGIITQDEYDKVKNLEAHIRKFKNNKRFKGDIEYENIISNIQDLKQSHVSDDKLLYIDENKDEFLRDKDKIYFQDYIAIFKLCLRLLTYLSIAFIIFILLLSIVAFFKLIYDIIVNVTSLFVNSDNSSRSLSLDYLSKTITRCTKDNFNDDRFFILTEQKQNINIFTIGIYILYLILLYLFVYFILFLYSKIADKTLIGDPTYLDKEGMFMMLLFTIIMYSIIHLLVYKYIFKQNIYSPYKELQLREKEIDTKLTEYILIYAQGPDNKLSDDILVDHKFFEILYDASRIDELNEIFMDGIKTNDATECLEQKIIIYNIYCYLREYIPFTEEMKEKFKNYCTSDANNKPKFTDSNIPMTFVAMLNNREIKMIRKYNEDLSYYSDIPDKNIEYFNELNTNITEKIKKINLLILTNTNTMIPFFLTIFYIFFIVILNLIVLYIIIFIVVSRKDITLKEFNPYVYGILYNIKIFVYDPIINFFIGGK